MPSLSKRFESSSEDYVACLGHGQEYQTYSPGASRPKVISGPREIYQYSNRSSKELDRANVCNTLYTSDVTIHKANKFMASRLPKSAFPVPATSETYVHQVFACIGAPNSQESFHTQLQEELVLAYQWLLDSTKFQSWHKSQLSTGSESMFCCRGEPDIGKTVFA
jgi:hypothetical protein